MTARTSAPCCFVLLAFSVVAVVSATGLEPSSTGVIHPHHDVTSMLQGLSRKPASLRRALLMKMHGVAQHSNNDFSAGPTYDTRYIQQPVNQFSNYPNATGYYNQRYLLSTTHWKQGGPIFFYAGNEADIVLFADNTGWMWEIAPEFGAMVVFAEHRYYGKSIPFDGKAFDDPAKLEWLTAEQALADFAKLLRSLRSEHSSPHSPIIVFGGSYGGMLATWFRVKYPHLVDGAIASSAPVLQFTDIIDSTVFNHIVTRTFAEAVPGCDQRIRVGWDILREFSQTAAGRQSIQDALHLCSTPSQDDVLSYLFPWIDNAFVYMAMADYPYPTTFLGPMPGNPVNVSCSYFKDVPPPDSTPASKQRIIEALHGAVSVFYNWTDDTTSASSAVCFNITSAGPDTLGLSGWEYQACTEMILPIGQNGVDDMFYAAPWNLSQYEDYCRSAYGVQPRPHWVPLYYGAVDITKGTSSLSNIVFTNGNLDPWSGGGVGVSTKYQWPSSWSDGSGSVHTIMIKGGAHHLDLRTSNTLDPQSVVDTRNQMKRIIRGWVQSASQLQVSCPWTPPPDDRPRSAGPLILLAILLVGAVIAAGVWLYRRCKHADADPLVSEMRSLTVEQDSELAPALS